MLGCRVLRVWGCRVDEWVGGCKVDIKGVEKVWGCKVENGWWVEGRDGDMMLCRL